MDCIKEIELSFCPVPGMKYETHAGPGFVPIDEVVIKEDGSTILVYLEDLNVDTEAEQDRVCDELHGRGWDS